MAARGGVRRALRQDVERGQQGGCDAQGSDWSWSDSNIYRPNGWKKIEAEGDAGADDDERADGPGDDFKQNKELKVLDTHHTDIVIRQQEEKEREEENADDLDLNGIVTAGANGCNSDRL